MAVKSVKERAERRRSSFREGQTVHSRVYLVECTDAADGTAVALNADDGVTRVPGPRDSFHGVPFSGKDADPVSNSSRHFEVQVEYAAPGEPEQDDVHPLDRPPDITYGSDGVTEPYFLDRSEPPKVVANSAGEAPDQFRDRERGDLVITFIRNVEWWDAAALEAYGNTINADTVVIDGTFYPPLTLKLSPPTAARQVETARINGIPQEVVYYRATFVIKSRSEGWNDKLLDTGYNELIDKVETVNGVSTLVKKLQPIYDRAAGTLRKPWPLDGQGRKKASPAETPAELEFKPYTARSWAALYF